MSWVKCEAKDMEGRKIRHVDVQDDGYIYICAWSDTFRLHYYKEAGKLIVSKWKEKE